ncbi:MAG: glucose-1-phosphate thymidylyltransferase [Cryomorphaceae bacterium]|nr:glucose-1-phosphate thymidylyltransferase [Cryomorphaceae bacterium]
MHTILFDDFKRLEFLPLAFTRPIGALRFGISKLSEKWLSLLNTPVSFNTEPYLQEKFPLFCEANSLWINARAIPNLQIRESLLLLQPGEGFGSKNAPIAFRTSNIPEQGALLNDIVENISFKDVPAPIKMLANITDLFSLNHEAITYDFERLTANRPSAKLSQTCTVIGDPTLVFVGQNVVAEGSFFNTTGGPIYLSDNSEVMEGSILRGPIALCEHATIKAGSKIYGATTIGPHCKVGGEVSNSLLMGYSNKGHDGFLGNSVLGEWCNLGADTNTSNLKNNYSEVKIWNYASRRMANSGLTFCGLIMGDHSKCGINTMFNTGTTAGVAANIFGGGFPPKFIPSFTWGGADGTETYDFDKAMMTAERVMARRHIDLTEQDIAVLRHIFESTETFRS